MKPELEEVIKQYSRNIYLTAYAVTGSRQDAEDVLQETLIAYAASGKDYDSMEHVRAWLLRTASNKALNVRRSFWNRNRTDMEEYMTESRENESTSVLHAVSRLNPGQAQAVHLYYYEGYSIREIAGILRIPEGTVKSRLALARKQLKKILQEEWENE